MFFVTKSFCTIKTPNKREIYERKEIKLNTITICKIKAENIILNKLYIILKIILT